MKIFKIKEIGFGESYYGTSDIESLIPKEVPDKVNRNTWGPAWNAIAENWFNNGLGKDSRLTPVYGIDKEKAIKHIQCLFNTWFLDKETKIKSAAYLISQWFTEIKL